MPQAQGTSHWWPTFGIMLGGLTVALNSGVLNVAIPSMMSSLSTDLDRIQWVQTSFQIIQAVMIPAVGWLGARVGTKRLFILSPLVFITGSALCGLAWNVPSLILFRTLQGIGGGPITPLSMSILYSTFPPDKRGLALGLSNFSHSFGPAIAPALGGHLIDVLSWRAIFYVNVPVGLLSAVIVFFTMPKTQDERSSPFDALGVFTMASFLILLLLAVSEGRRYGWGSQMILMLFVASVLSLVVFVVAELKTTQPFVELRLYKNLPFAMGCLIGFVNTMEFRGTNFLLPIMLQRIYHYTPFQAGLFFPPSALVMGLLDPRRAPGGHLSTQVPADHWPLGADLCLVQILWTRCLGHDRASPGAGRAPSGGAGVLPLSPEFVHAAWRAGRPGTHGERPLQPASHRGGDHGGGSHGDADGLS
jgi:EmrB/QacA subfamily drug resistance transporter